MNCSYLLHVCLCVLACQITYVFSNYSPKMETIYQGDYYKVDNVFTPYGTFRKYGPSLTSENFSHGFISLDNVDHIQPGYMKLVMASLYLQPTKKPKRILIIGLGIGVLPKSLDQILKDAYIDVVEIDQICLELAKEYFYYNTSDRVRVHIGDGYDFVMNLTKEQTYDIIVMDAFMDYSEETCTPPVFLTDYFVRRVKEHLAPNGVYAINTIPQFCSQNSYELALFHNHFGRLYFGKHHGNKVVLGQKARKAPTNRQIKSRVRYYREAFQTLGIDSNWLVATFHNFKRFRQYLPAKTTDWFSYTFVNNVCPY